MSYRRIACLSTEAVEIKSADILSPGPSAVTEGLAQLERIVMRWVQAAK